MKKSLIVGALLIAIFAFAPAVKAEDVSNLDLILELQAQILELQQKINELLGQSTTPVVVEPVDPIEPYPITLPPYCPHFDYAFAEGTTDAMTAGQVTQLQSFLQEEGDFYLDPTGYYGPVTDAAVQSWHDRQGVDRVPGHVIWCPPTHLGKLRVISPNGGETWEMGERVKILWSSAYPQYESGDIPVPVPLESDATSVTGSVLNATAGNVAMDGIAVEEIAVTDMLIAESDSVRITLEEVIDCGPYEDCILGYSVYTIAERTLNDGHFVWTVGNSLSDQALRPGSYWLAIEDVHMGTYDRSDRPIKIVDEDHKDNHPPVIKGVSGPTFLDVWERGTWEVIAEDPDNDALKYSVDWGDGPYYLAAEDGAAATDLIAQQNTTFTHSYAHAGNYTVRFTVSDHHGGTAVSTMTVYVNTDVVDSCPDVAVPVSNDILCGYSPNYDAKGCIISFNEWCADSIAPGTGADGVPTMDALSDPA